MNAIQPVNHPIPADLQTVWAFGALAQQVARTVAASSARVYMQTYAAWATWCETQGLNPVELRPGDVMDFLESGDTTKATRQRQLSALRKFAEMRYILQPDDAARRTMEALRVIKAPVDTSAGAERSRRALEPSQADKLLRVWRGDVAGDTPQDARNRSLVALLLLAGVRRSEAAALRWRDVDFENGVLHIAHGKGDKARDVPIAGDFALDALRDWQQHQGSGREWLFCPVERGGSVGADRPISGTDVYRVWDATATAAGVDCKPHDARRTFITEALATGTPLATVQAAAGHAQGQTTLRYAQAVDARRARKELRLRYG